MSEWTDKLEGKAKEIKGKVTGDRTEELEGKAQEIKGAVEGKADDLKGTWNQDQTGQTPDHSAGAGPGARRDQSTDGEAVAGT